MCPARLPRSINSDGATRVSYAPALQKYIVEANHITSPQWLPNLRPVYPTAIVVVGWKHRSAHTQFEQHLYLALAVGRFSSSSSSSSLGWQFLLLYRFASQNGSGGGRVEQGEDTVCCWGARVPAVSGGPRGIYYLFFHPTPALFIHDWVTDWLVGGLGWFMVGAYRWRWRMRVSLLLVLVVQTEWWCPLSFHDSPPTQQ